MIVSVETEILLILFLVIYVLYSRLIPLFSKKIIAWYSIMITPIINLGWIGWVII